MVTKFLRAKKALNFKKWLKFYLNMNSRPIFSVLTNNCTIWTNAIQIDHFWTKLDFLAF